MTLEKLATLRDKYAVNVGAYQDARRDGETSGMSKAKAAMRRAGKSYLNGIDKALVKHTEVEVNAVIGSNA